ncbi:unnamed protein product [Scytosiphon promiscuus]
MRLSASFFPEAVLLLCLCRVCSAFFLEAGRLGSCTSAGSKTWSAIRTATGRPTRVMTPARPRRRSLKTNRCSESAKNDEANEANVAASGIAAAGSLAHSGTHASHAATEDDPFRPERASVSPLIINALVPVLFKEDTKAVDAAASVLEQRSKNSDWTLTEEEEGAVTERLCGVEAHLDELRFMLATAVGRTPWIAKYGMLPDYGMGDNVEEDPLAQINQAECLLALYMLHKEGARAEDVDFLDAEKLEVLQGGG